jgi:hypothetical protein
MLFHDLSSSEKKFESGSNFLKGLTDLFSEKLHKLFTAFNRPAAATMKE